MPERLPPTPAEIRRRELLRPGPVTRERRCDCCDLPVSSCGVEAERRIAQAATVRRAQLLQLPGVIAARYPGPCFTCGERFDAGAPIRPVAGNRGHWQCLECCDG